MKTKNNLSQSPKSLVYIFTGDGKGKTSAALGVAMRAVGQGKRAAMVQWYKEKLKAKSEKLKVNTGAWLIGEHQLPELLKKPLFKIYPMGQGFYKLPTDHATPDEHRQAAKEALELAERLLNGQMAAMATMARNSSEFNRSNRSNHSNRLFLLILDESLNAVNDGLIELHELMNLLTHRQETHIILTGRRAPKKLIAVADLVTEMKNLKHPYEKGKKAVWGLDY